MSGYSDEHIIEIINADAAPATTSTAAGPRRKLFRHQCYGLSEDKISGTTTGSSTWPLDHHIADIDTGTLSTLEAISCRYYKVGSLLSFRTKLSNGTESTVLGSSGAERNSGTAVIPAGALRQIKIQASQNWLNGVKFCDANGNELSSMMGDSGVGDWHTIQLQQNESFVGFHEWHDKDNYVRRVGIITLRP